MKSFSQFLAEKESLSPYYDQYGKRIPWSEVTRQDVGMASKDPINVTPDSEDIKTKKENTGNNKTKKITKKTSGSGKIVFKARPGEIKLQKQILKQQTPGTNTSIVPSKSGNVIKTYKNKVTTSLSNVKDPITSIEKGPRRTITKPPVTTNVSKPVKYKGFIDRVVKATGVESPITKKFSPNTKVTGLSAKDTKKLVTKARVGGLLKGAGRFAGGAFAAKDAYDKARIEKAKGRSKTSQILGGIARGAGGYLGAAAGATLGTIAGGGVGSAVLGTGGAIAGYNVGTKVGDYLYKKGRQLATGKTGEAAKTKFKDFMKKIRK